MIILLGGGDHVLHVQVDLVLWCYSLLVAQSILLNENYEGGYLVEGYLYIFGLLLQNLIVWCSFIVTRNNPSWKAHLLQYNHHCISKNQ